jgi:hypothetical protein
VPSILAVGSFTLSPNVTQTTVIATCTPASVVTISPTTPHAANDRATTSVTAGNGQFTVTHANNPLTDRTSGYTVVG